MPGMQLRGGVDTQTARGHAHSTRSRRFHRSESLLGRADPHAGGRAPASPRILAVLNDPARGSVKIRSTPICAVGEIRRSFPTPGDLRGSARFSKIMINSVIWRVLACFFGRPDGTGSANLINGSLWLTLAHFFRGGPHEPHEPHGPVAHCGSQWLMFSGVAMSHMAMAISIG